MSSSIIVVKPEVVGHIGSRNIRHAIYSVDFQPNGNRLATGGGDSVVRIWNTFSLLGIPEEAENSMLSTLTAHAGSVNVVRWSKDGKLLASGSDDTYIFIYHYSSVPPTNSSFGSKPAANDKKSTESWPRCFTLQGHSMDILDLDWSPKGTLASASIDNKILIWDLESHQTSSYFGTGKTSSVSSILTPVKVLSTHQSFVKGISFDPLMKYLASSSSDNTLILWDVDNNFKETHRITELFANVSDRTLVTRLSWAPDGSSLCATSTIKSSKPLSSVLRRGTWESVADFVGHEVETLSCRFLPAILHHKIPSVPSSISESSTGSSSDAGPPQSKSEPSCIVAVGDLQGVISIWSSSRKRAVITIDSLFTGAVSDLSWTLLQNSSSRNSGSRAIMCASSVDGFTALVDFGSNLGTPLTESELEKHHTLLYGANNVGASNSSRCKNGTNRDLSQPLLPSKLLANANGGTMLSDPSLGLSFTLPTAAMPKPNLYNGFQSSPKPTKPVSSQPIDTSTYSAEEILIMQKLTVTRAGKKRVCPVTIETTTELSEAPPLTSTSATSPAASTTDTNKRVRFDEDEPFADSKTANIPVDTSDDYDVYAEPTSIRSFQPQAQQQSSTSISLLPNNATPNLTATSTTSANDRQYNSVNSNTSKNLSQHLSTSSGAKNRLNLGEVATSFTNTSNSNVLIPPMANASDHSTDNLYPVTALPRGVPFLATNVFSITIRSKETVCAVPLLLTPPKSQDTANTDTTENCVRSIVKRVSNPIVVTPNNSSSSSISFNKSNSNSSSTRVDNHDVMLLHAIRVPRPAYLDRAARHTGENVCTVSLRRGAEAVWNASIVGLVTCLCAHEWPQLVPTSSVASTNTYSNGLLMGIGLGLGLSAISSSVTQQLLSTSYGPHGICAVGCADGSLHLYSLTSGMKISCALVLGLPIVCVDISMSSSNSSHSCLQTSPLPLLQSHVNHTCSHCKDCDDHLRMLACTADGDVHVWRLTFNDQTGAVSLQSTCKTSIQPAIQSMRNHHALNTCSASNLTSTSTQRASNASTTTSSTDDPMVTLDRCSLTHNGAPLITLKVQPEAGRSSSRPYGGAMQSFLFDSIASVWMRVADMRHVLSRLFTVSSIPFTTSPTSETGTLVQHHSDLSVEGIQTAAALGDGFNMSTVVEMATMHSAIQKECIANESRVSSYGSSTPLSNQTLEALAMKRWSDSISLAHVEDQLCVAISIGTEREVQRWLGEWVYFCCKGDLTDRVRWVVECLLKQCRSEQQMGAIAADIGTKSSKDGGSSCQDSFQTVPSETSAHSRSKARVFLQDLVLPAMASSGCAAGLVAQAFAELEDLS